MKRFIVAAAAVALCLAGAAAHPSLHFVKRIGTGPGPWMSFVAFSPDGKRIASTGPPKPDDIADHLTIWSFPDGRLVQTLPGRPMAISPDWTSYADDKSIRDMKTGAVKLALPQQGWSLTQMAAVSDADRALIKHTLLMGSREVGGVAYSADGRFAAEGHWDIIALHDARTDRHLAVLRGMGRYVDAMAFSPDSRLLAAGSDYGRLQLWDVRRHRRLWSLDLEGGYVSTPAFSPDGRLVAVGIYGTGTVFLIDVRKGRLVDHKRVADLACGSVAFSPDGRYLITPSAGGLITWPYDIAGMVKVFRVRR